MTDEQKERLAELEDFVKGYYNSYLEAKIDKGRDTAPLSHNKQYFMYVKANDLLGKPNGERPMKYSYEEKAAQQGGVGVVAKGAETMFEGLLAKYEDRLTVVKELEAELEEREFNPWEWSGGDYEVTHEIGVEYGEVYKEIDMLEEFIKEIENIQSGG